MRRVVTVVSKRGCHMCEKVAEALSALSSRYDVEVRVLDIKDSQELHDKYFLTIPAVLVDGKDVFDARDMTPGPGYAKKLEQILQR
jgi:glutaredoxin